MRKISDDLCFFGTYVGQNIAILFVETQYSVKHAMTLSNTACLFFLFNSFIHITSTYPRFGGERVAKPISYLANYCL